MTDPCTFVVTVGRTMRDEEPANLWRHAGDAWECLSLIDWAWHAVPDDRVKRPPAVAERVEIDAERAAELEDDRQALVAYWALYDMEDDPATTQPYTVVRRRCSPELVLDEAYTRRDGWIRTGEIVEWDSSGRASQPPRLVPLEPAAADDLLFELKGVRGATQLGSHDD